MSVDCLTPVSRRVLDNSKYALLMRARVSSMRHRCTRASSRTRGGIFRNLPKSSEIMVKFTIPASWREKKCINVLCNQLRNFISCDCQSDAVLIIHSSGTCSRRANYHFHSNATSRPVYRSRKMQCNFDNYAWVNKAIYCKFF